MGLYKYFLVFILYLHALASSLAESSQKQKIYKKVFFNHDHNECVCFEQNHDLMTVPQHLDPQNNDIERLIIVLYKTKNGTLYTYTPNRIKQSVLPDLQYEAGDSISNVPNELLDKLFSNSNKSIKYPWPMEKQNGIYPLIGPVKSIHKPGCKKQNNMDNRGKASSKCKADKDVEEIPKNNIYENVNLLSPDQKEPISKNDSMTIIPPTNNISKNVKQITPYSYQKETISKDNNVMAKILPPNNISENIKQITLHQKVPISKDDSRTIILPPNNNSQNVKLVTPHQKVPISKDDSSTINLPRNSISENAKQITPHREPNRKDDSMNYIPPNLKGNMKQFGISSFHPNYVSKYNPNDKQNLPVKEKSFNKWFIDQMKNLEVRDSLDQPINCSALEQYILTALKEHGLALSPSGTLTDIRGNIFNISNLYVRPVLIGEYIKYDSIKANPNGSYVLSDISPYMDSVLIAVLDPPKILAIIPLGKVKVPKTMDFRHVLYNRKMPLNKQNKSKRTVKLSSYDNNVSPIQKISLNKNHKTSTDSENIIRNINSLSKDLISKVYILRPNNIDVDRNNITENFHADIQPEDVNDITDSTILPGRLRTGSKSAVKNHFKKKILSYIRPSFIEVDNDDDIDIIDFRIIEKTSTMIPGLKTSRKVLPYINKQPKYIEKKRKSEVIPFYTHPEPIPIEVDDDDDDYLDFRIIGGAAATGSGIPISNRGRSGKFSFD